MNSSPINPKSVRTEEFARKQDQPEKISPTTNMTFAQDLLKQTRSVADPGVPLAARVVSSVDSHAAAASSAVQETPILVPKPQGVAQIGNSCYLNSVSQALVGLKGYMQKIKEPLEQLPGELPVTFVKRKNLQLALCRFLEALSCEPDPTIRQMCADLLNDALFELGERGLKDEEYQFKELSMRQAVIDQIVERYPNPVTRLINVQDDIILDQSARRQQQDAAIYLEVILDQIFLKSSMLLSTITTAADNVELRTQDNTTEKTMPLPVLQLTFDSGAKGLEIQEMVNRYVSEEIDDPSNLFKEHQRYFKINHLVSPDGTYPKVIPIQVVRMQKPKQYPEVQALRGQIVKFDRKQNSLPSGDKKEGLKAKIKALRSQVEDVRKKIKQKLTEDIQKLKVHRSLKANSLTKADLMNIDLEIKSLTSQLQDQSIKIARPLKYTSNPLDLNVLYGKKGLPELKYGLKSFVTHFGEGLNSGHYKGYRLVDDGCWYEFDDDKPVRKIADKDLPLLFEQAYLVFYEQIPSVAELNADPIARLDARLDRSVSDIISNLPTDKLLDTFKKGSFFANLFSPKMSENQNKDLTRFLVSIGQQANQVIQEIQSHITNDTTSITEKIRLLTIAADLQKKLSSFADHPAIKEKPEISQLFTQARSQLNALALTMKQIRIDVGSSEKAAYQTFDEKRKVEREGFNLVSAVFEAERTQKKEAEIQIKKYLSELENLKGRLTVQGISEEGIQLIRSDISKLAQSIRSLQAGSSSTAASAALAVPKPPSVEAKPAAALESKQPLEKPKPAAVPVLESKQPLEKPKPKVAEIQKTQVKPSELGKRPEWFSGNVFD